MLSFFNEIITFNTRTDNMKDKINDFCKVKKKNGTKDMGSKHCSEYLTCVGIILRR